MLVAHLACSIFLKTPMTALLLFQSSSETQRFDLWEMWTHMGWPARSVAIILLAMSAWSIGVMMDRWLAFPCRAQAIAPVCAGGCRSTA
jgi:biopolymer transport protein ExbB/biopolymer transport protein TolQ